MANGNRKREKHSQTHFRKKGLDNCKQKQGIMINTAHVAALEEKNKKDSCKHQVFKEKIECLKTEVKVTKPVKKKSELSRKIGSTACTLNKTTTENGSEISKQVLTSHGESKNCDSKERMMKKSRKKRSKQDGASNWLNLCSTLNIAVPKKSKRSTKRQAETKLPDPETKRAKSEIWFDNVDEILIENTPSVDLTVTTSTSEGVSSNVTDASGKLVKPDSFPGMTNCVAMDCEMVGIGPKGDESILARVSIVNHFGVCLYDKFVLPREKVTDYRTFVSGVTQENLATGEDFLKVQKEVSSILKGRVLVGHAVHNDLRVLFLTHPHKDLRDTSQFKPFRELFGGRSPSLKKLTDRLLGVRVQEGQHSSVQDAQATMRLYTMHRQRWEKELRAKRNSIKRKRTQKKKKKKKTEAAD